MADGGELVKATERLLEGRHGRLGASALRAALVDLYEFWLAGEPRRPASTPRNRVSRWSPWAGSAAGSWCRSPISTWCWCTTATATSARSRTRSGTLVGRESRAGPLGAHARRSAEGRFGGPSHGDGPARRPAPRRGRRADRPAGFRGARPVAAHRAQADPGLAASVRQRWSRSGEIAQSAEPDLKHGRGGLRDFAVLEALAAAQLTARPGEELLEAKGLLLDVRTELRRRSGANGTSCPHRRPSWSPPNSASATGSTWRASFPARARTIAYALDVALRSTVEPPKTAVRTAAVAHAARRRRGAARERGLAGA